MKTRSSRYSAPLSAISVPSLVKKMPANCVESPVTESQQLACLADLKVGRQHSRAPQHRLDAGKKLARRKRLRKIVVGSHFEPDDPVHLVIARGQHDDRRRFVLAGAKFPAKDQPVIARHHHVEYDQIDRAGFKKIAHLAAIGGNCRPKTVFLQIARHQFANFTIVVDDQIYDRHAPSFVFQTLQSAAERHPSLVSCQLPRVKRFLAATGRPSELRNIQNGLCEGLRRLLRQIVPDAPG